MRFSLGLVAAEATTPHTIQRAEGYFLLTFFHRTVYMFSFKQKRGSSQHRRGYYNIGGVITTKQANFRPYFARMRTRQHEKARGTPDLPIKTTRFCNFFDFHSYPSYICVGRRSFCTAGVSPAFPRTAGILPAFFDAMEKNTQKKDAGKMPAVRRRCKRREYGKNAGKMPAVQERSLRSKIQRGGGTRERLSLDLATAYTVSNEYSLPRRQR